MVTSGSFLHSERIRMTDNHIIQWVILKSNEILEMGWKAFVRKSMFF